MERNKIIEIAKNVSTPMYLFDLDALNERIKNMKAILGENVTLCYAMKANPFLVDAMRNNAPKYEVCSPGEFAICERENIAMEHIVLSGVNKERADIEHVMKDCGGAGIYTIESVSQFNLINECAVKYNVTADVLLRVTSGNQFGLDEEQLEKIVEERQDYPHICIKGIQCYTGTQKKKMSIIGDELIWLDKLCDRLKASYGFIAEELEYGPGLSYHYFGQEAYANDFIELTELSDMLKPLKSKYKITLEMGRYIAAECGMFISTVADVKNNKGVRYCIIDGGINHINYYGQTMAMKIPAFTMVKKDGTVVDGQDTNLGDNEKCTICGSLCTVGDVIVKNLPLGEVSEGDMIIFYNIGAYSVTEGIYLFLSRKMPAIAAYSKENGVIVYRDFMPTDTINSRISQL
ncbi:MAG: alanine racemase [Eubacteriales bacterium]|nr:alanine racemase [Eubacteriales bacterium]